MYLVKIEGESMTGAGIYDGDLVIVDSGREPQGGEFVIAALNDEPVCKRLHHSDQEVSLHHENELYSPRFILESGATRELAGVS